MFTRGHSIIWRTMRRRSSTERPFAVTLDNDSDVKMFFKIPDHFKIETPIGIYNPDWTVYLTKNGEEKLSLKRKAAPALCICAPVNSSKYIVVETL